MLILSRKSQESIVVGRADTGERMLKVTVLDVVRGRVRLGFEGDSSISIHRTEVWERIRAGGLAAVPVECPVAPIA